MTRAAYMKSLERLLSALPETERRDALNYYEEYFDDAGSDREAETIAELGTPEEVAQKILDGQEFVPAEMASAPDSPAAPRARRRTRWHPLAVGAVLAVAALTFITLRLPSRNAVKAPLEGDTVVTLNEVSSPLESSTFYEVDLNCMKKLSLDLDIGSVAFVSQKDLQSARIEVENLDDRFQLDYSFDPAGSHFNYTTPRSVKNADSLSLTIYLPEDFQMDKLDAELDMGNLDLGDLTVRDLTADLDMGNCKADCLTADTADLDLDMGTLCASVLDVRDLTASTDMGNIQIGLLRSTENASLESDMGTITLTAEGSLSDYAVNAANDFGKLTVNGQQYAESFHSRGSRSLSLSNSMGSTTLRFQN